MTNTIRTYACRVSMMIAAAAAVLGTAASIAANVEPDDMHWNIVAGGVCPDDMHWSVDLKVCVTNDMHW